MKYLLCVVEQPAVPKLMFAAWPIMEETAICAIKLIQTIMHILTGVRVNDIQQHVKTKTMCLVHAFLQFLRIAISAGRRIKTGHLIAETSIIGVLHNCHQLNGIVALTNDAGQDVLGEIVVRSHF